MRFQLVRRDENIATRKLAPAPQGAVKIRNSPVGRGLSAVRVNEDIHDKVFLTFAPVHHGKLRVHARATCTRGERPPLSYEGFRTRA